MGWITRELEERGGGGKQVDRGANQRTAPIAQRAWEQLKRELEMDVEEFKGHGGDAQVSYVSEQRMKISEPRTGLEVLLTLDLNSSLVRYDFSSTEKRVAAPEGGILSLRSSQAGEPEIYSADERITSERARRLLLQPILLDSKAAA
jgi:hypothetical protein